MPHAGQRISEYILESPLGKGAFGEVWKARHHVWDSQYVAVKIPIEPNYLRQLQREGATVHGLNHPNIVRAIGFDPYADPPYLMMELVPGTSLRPFITERKLDIEQTMQIMRQILAGLGYAHQAGLVHRDIKPENILIHERAFKEGFRSEGVVKVTDFGLGQAACNTANESIVLSTSLHGKAASELAGTIDYMSPEQRAGEPVDGRSDLYACGVILYEMLTGEKPAGTELPSDRNKTIPKHLDEVFRKSYARLDKRYATAEQFAGDLIGNDRPVPVPPPLPGARVSGPVRVCPSCRANVAPGDQFCIQCGTQLVSQVRRCSRCGAYPDASDRYCLFCGQAMPPSLVAIG